MTITIEEFRTGTALDVKNMSTTNWSTVRSSAHMSSRKGSADANYTQNTVTESTQAHMQRGNKERHTYKYDVLFFQNSKHGAID